MNCSDVVERSWSYLSGALNARESEEFAAHLEGCGACARTLELDARLRGAILAEACDASAVEERVRERIGAGAGLRRFSIAAGAAAAIAAMLAAALFVYRDEVRVSPVYADAALDHRQEVVEHERRTWVSDADAIMALLARLGLADPAVAAFSPRGYRLEGARLCRLNGKVFLHLVYTDGPHEISVFVGQPDAAHARGPETASFGSEYVAAFETSRVSGLVVAEQSRDRTVEIARDASSAL